VKDKSSKFITGTHGSLSVVTVNANVIERKKKKEPNKPCEFLRK
jgi:hypothetical protein